MIFKTHRVTAFFFALVLVLPAPGTAREYRPVQSLHATAEWDRQALAVPLGAHFDGTLTRASHLKWVQAIETPPAKTAEDAWRADLIATGMAPDDIGPLAVHDFPARQDVHGTLLLRAADIRQLMPVFGPRWHILLMHQRDEMHLQIDIPSPEKNSDQRLMCVDLLILYGQIMLHEGFWSRDNVQKLTGYDLRSRYWLQTILLPWLLERGFEHVRMPYVKPQSHVYKALGIDPDDTSQRKGLYIHIPTYLALARAV